MKLSLCMIVKNEEEHLPRCLKSVQGVVDEIVVVDTGSTDQTVAIAESFGAKVYHFPWVGDFSAARNFSLEKATGDWIIFLDADEELVEGDGPKLRELIASGEADGYYLTEISFVGDKPGIDAVMNTTFRVFRNRPEYRFAGAIHEQIVACVQKHGGEIAFSNVRINHYGYLNPVSADKSKIQRNLEILRKEVQKRPEDNFTRFNIGVEYLRLHDYEAALREFRKAFHKLPTLELAYASVLLRNIALCLKELRRYGDALAVLADATEAYPDYTDPVFLKACIYAEMRDFDAAVAAYKECLARGESNPRHVTQQGVGSYRAWYGLGQAYEQMGDYAQAVRAYTEALKSNRYFLGPVFNLAGILVPREEVRAIKEFFARYLDLDDPETLVVLGQAFFLEKCYQEALEYVEAALSRGGPSQRLLFQKGEILLNLGRYAEATACFQELENGAYHLQAGLSRVFCLLMQERSVEALKVLDRLAKEESAQPCVSIYRDFAALLAGCSPLSASGARKGRVPGEVEGVIFDLLGKLLELQEFEKFARALALVERIPERGRRLRLGKLYFKYGFRDSAVEELLAAVQAGAQDAEALAILAEIAAEKGFDEEAVVFYRHALELDKEAFRYYTALASILSRLRRYQEARAVVEQGLRRFPASSLLRAVLRGVEAATNFQEREVVGCAH